jgi:hypothetical protein
MGVPCYLRYLSDPTIVANRCAVGVHRADTSENGSRRHDRCSDVGQPATGNALQLEKQWIGSEPEGDRAGRLPQPLQERQPSDHIGHIEGEFFAYWAPF